MDSWTGLISYVNDLNGTKSPEIAAAESAIGDLRLHLAATQLISWLWYRARARSRPTIRPSPLALYPDSEWSQDVVALITRFGVLRGLVEVQGEYVEMSPTASQQDRDALLDAVIAVYKPQLRS